MGQCLQGKAAVLLGFFALGFFALVTLITLAIRQFGDGMADESTSQSGPPAGFQDLAEQAGITFRMQFLSQEQGENFKGNLYDHGCGLAIGDFDGDGFDDIYFLNQCGSNALYRNTGDGRFVDVTQEAGVGLGDRVCAGASWADTTTTACSICS